MIKRKGRNLIETSYEVSEEAKNSSIFGIGNGYYGMRGSFEEFGDVYIQGFYVRGAFDEIIEIPPAISHNLYMKRYYFDAEKLKEFEKEDSCINIADPSSMKVYVGGKELLPWEMKIVSWRRFIDYGDGSLKREVVYEDEEGNKTKVSFHKIPCFHNNHLFLQEVSVKALNHDLKIEVFSGVDTMVKTNGQHKSVLIYKKQDEESSCFGFNLGDKYKMDATISFKNEASNADYVLSANCHETYGDLYEANGRECVIRKVVFIWVSCDRGYVRAILGKENLPAYHYVYKKHLEAYRPLWKEYDIKIKGNKEADAYLRYANYQTLIGIDRHDQVHSLSAKNLTAEQYNQFVWWDAEIFQEPAYVNALPEATKKCLMYRVRRLPEARKIARKENRRGARFPFCSSVKGDENVWIYAKHPFLQIHASSDIAYSAIAYYKATGDKSFMMDHGLKLITEILIYFKDRAILNDGQYQLLQVTGTDEHHYYVDNDAYTNYQVAFLLKETLRLISELNFEIDEGIKKELEDFKNRLKLPLPNQNGVIPQFDGYFDLKSYLPLEGASNPGFQMKSSGLYNLSQVIKQPDVLMLYNYLNIQAPGDYKANWKFYEKRCEASSSLTYPCHAFSAIDNDDIHKFHYYFLASVKMDFDDIYGSAKNGIHAGALAGARIAIINGLAGFKNEEKFLIVKPKYDDYLGDIFFNYRYHDSRLKCHLTPNGLEIISDKSMIILSDDKEIYLSPKKKILIPIQKRFKNLKGGK